MKVEGNMQKPAKPTESGAVRMSVIIPTFQRRDVVVASVRALANQEFNGNFEVIVVVDGSTDGSVQALEAIQPPFALTVLDQSNRGRAAALNAGAQRARGEILLFLDDDMEAHSHLLAEHDRSHRAGADLVLGHIPLHAASPSNFLSAAVGLWTVERTKRLSSPAATLELHDLITGQASVSRQLFYRLGGFDTAFNRGGAFGNEDLDFCHRLRLEGYRIVFNPEAISWQKYMVTPRHHLRQWRQAGGADVAFARKHPDQTSAIFALHPAESLIGRLAWRPLRRFVLTFVDRWPHYTILTRSFFWLRELEYWQGVRAAGGMPSTRSLRVLAYHAIADLAGAPILEQYGVPADVFRGQLDILQQAGYHFVDADEFLRFLNGDSGLPRKALLLTFDDCYDDLLKVALPILKERRIPAVAFAVSGRLGGTNDWDKEIGAPQIRLIDADGLRALAAAGIEIGAHSRTHRPLPQVPAEELQTEIAGSVADLETLGLARPRFFAYPHGEHNQSVQRAIQEAGLRVAFSVDPNRVAPDQNPYQIPRIEIFRADVGWKFRWKVARAGRSLISLKRLASLRHA